jgi:putative membrane protein
LLGLENFGFRAVWSPGILLTFVLIAVIYVWIAGTASRQFGGSPASFAQKTMFLSGLILLYLSQGGPLNLLAHMMFSVHMLVMSITFLVVPPLLIMGLPKWIWERWTQLKLVRSLRLISHPLITVLLFNMLFSFYHIPMIHDYVMTHYSVHIIYYIMMFCAAMLMFWPILSPVPVTYGMSELKKMGYIFLNGVLLTPACGLIIFADHVLYATFNDPNIWAVAMAYCVPGGSAAILQNFSGPEVFQIFTPKDDQQLGGVIMKLIQEAIYGGILAYIFYQWYRKENPEGSDDLNPQLN